MGTPGLDHCCRGFLVLAVIGGSVGGGIGNNWLGFLISAAATVLMWVPNSQAWFAAVKGRG